MYMTLCHFSYQVTIAQWHCCSISREMTSKKFPHCITSKLISLSQCQLLEQVNNHILAKNSRKNGGRQSYYKRNWQETVLQYEYSAKERMDIGKYSTRCFGFHYYHTTWATHTHKLKLTLSCKLSTYKKLFYLNRQYLFH